MIIDSHVHIGYSIAMNTEVTPEFLIEQMSWAGVDRCLVFPFPSYGEIYGADWILELCDEYREFIPVYYVTEKFQTPPEVFVAIKWHWVGGVSDTASNYGTLKSEKLPEFVRSVSELDIPLIFEEELEFTRIFVEKFPDVKLIVPHLGLLGGNPVSFLREFRNRENVYFDTSLASQGTIKRFLDELGDDRVIFGSDVPFGVMESEAEKIKNLDVDKKVKRRLFHRNIEKI